MKLVIFSDIHGNQFAFNSFLKELEKIQYDKIIFLGDIFGYYYGQLEIIEKLENLDNLIWLKGNHDDMAVSLYYNNHNEKDYIERYGHCYQNIKNKFEKNTIEKISKLPEHIEITLDHKKIAMFHGGPNDFLNERIYPKDNVNLNSYKEFDYILMGHTHFKMLKKIDSSIIINPGSLGQQRDGKGFGYVILDTLLNEVQFNNIYFDKNLLYKEIDKFDHNFNKLKEILKRGE